MENSLSQTSISAGLARVRQARVFFAHHSVGGNLQDGMARLSVASGGDAFKAIPLSEAHKVDGPAWVDANGGKNGEPKSKIDFFAETIRSRRELQPRLAFMKFCYVDFNPSTDVDDLFSYYQRTMTALASEFPHITFAHVTVPLMTRPTTIKSRAQRLLGRRVWEDDANVKRDLFNKQLQKTFTAQPIFDLAAAESTRADGTRQMFAHAAGVSPSLVPEYTDDGGHLNDLGKRVVGARMIAFLASALDSRGP